MILVIGADTDQSRGYIATLPGRSDCVIVNKPISVSLALRYARADNDPVTVHLLPGWSEVRSEREVSGILDVLTATGTEWLHIEPSTEGTP